MIGDSAFANLCEDLINWSAEDRAVLDQLLAGVCFYLECEQPGELYQQNTQYEHKLSNWTCLCPEHRKQNDEHWEGRWAEYRGDVLGRECL